MGGTFYTLYICNAAGKALLSVVCKEVIRRVPGVKTETRYEHKCNLDWVIMH